MSEQVPGRVVPSGESDPTGGASTGGYHLTASAVTPGEAVARSGQDMFGATFGGDTSGFGGLVRRDVGPATAERPYGGWFDEAVDAFEAAFPAFSDAVLKVVIDRGELTLHLRPDTVRDVCRTMRDDPDLRFELLSSVSGVDYPAQRERLHAVYHLTSLTYRRRLRLEVAVPAHAPQVPSVCDVYPTADFHEREAWDMFGIEFTGHPALTRILMPDDWEGHPQRKDYPLGGVPVEYKGAQVPPPDERRAYA